MILGSLICSMTSCSVRPNSPTSNPKKARTMEATPAHRDVDGAEAEGGQGHGQDEENKDGGAHRQASGYSRLAITSQGP